MRCLKQIQVSHEQTSLLRRTCYLLRAACQSLWASQMKGHETLRPQGHVTCLLQLRLLPNCLATWPLLGLATVTGDLQTLACLIFLGRLWTLSQWGASQIQTLRPQGHVAFRLVNRVRHAILLQAESWHRFVGGRRMTSSCYPAFCNLLQLQLSSNCLATWPLLGLATVTGDLQSLACLIFL